MPRMLRTETTGVKEFYGPGITTRLALRNAAEVQRLLGPASELFPRVFALGSEDQG